MVADPIDLPVTVISKRCASPDHEGQNPLPLTEFHKNITGPGGFRSRCKACLSRDQAARRKAWERHETLAGRRPVCRVCKGPIRADARYDVCGRNPECLKINSRLHHNDRARRSNPYGYLPCVSCGGDWVRRGGREKLCGTCRETKFWCIGAVGTDVGHASLLAVKVGVVCRACRLLREAQRRAERRGIPFVLTWQYVESIWPDACPYLGVPLQHGVGKMCSASPTLDRVEPVKGYVEGNVEVISWLANVMKNSATKAQLVSFAQEVFRRFTPDFSEVI